MAGGGAVVGIAYYDVAIRFAVIVGAVERVNKRFPIIGEGEGVYQLIVKMSFPQCGEGVGVFDYDFMYG